MLSRSLLVICLAPIISATKLEIYVKYSGGGGMDLGGGSTWSDAGVTFRIDDGEWKPIKNAKSDFLCAHYCDYSWTSEYTLGDLGGREFYMCQIGGNCVPGNDFSCKIWYNGEEKTFDSYQEDGFVGVATSTTSWCGGTFEDA
ncbi:hypothetical protein Q7P35_002859 [Cladosporium inversicolor]